MYRKLEKLPPLKCGAATAKINHSGRLINVQTVCEGQGRALCFTYYGSGDAPIGPNNEKAQVSIGDV